MSGKKIPYYQFKNAQVCQEVVLIGLLNKYASITLSLKRRKIEKEILTFFHVDEIQFEDEIIECDKVVEKHCSDIKKSDLENGINYLTA